jgi:adenylylsulfate kinase-like enzyme
VLHEDREGASALGSHAVPRIPRRHGSEDRLVISEPAHVPEQPVVILVVGVPGAGKSSVARALAERLERAACIEGDLVQHHFTVTGLVGPGELPAEESHRQMQLRWRNCADLARNFWQAGFTVIVEHAVSRREWIDRFVQDIGPAPVSLVVLAPSREVTLERDRQRDEKQVAHLFTHMDAELRDDLSGLGYWLDSSGLTVDQTVDCLLAIGISAGRLDH